MDSYSNTGLGGVEGVMTITADDQFSNAVAGEDAAGDISNEQSLSDDVAIRLPSEDGSTELAATFTEFTANGADFSYSDVESNAKYFSGFAVEESAGAAIIGPFPTFFRP